LHAVKVRNRVTGAKYPSSLATSALIRTTRSAHGGDVHAIEVRESEFTWRLCH
jgi:hypothetical protein